MLDFASVIIIISALVNIFLAILVFWKKRHNASMLWFSAFIFSLVAWCIAILFTHLTRIPEHAAFWGKLIYGSGLLIATVLFIFANIFPEKHYKISKKIQIPVFAVSGVLFIITVFTNYIIKEAQIPLSGDATASYGFAYLFYIFYISALMFSSLYLLFRTYKHAKGMMRVQSFYVFCGILFTVLIGGLTNIVLPTLGYFKLWAVMGPASTLFVIFFVIYAILKHHLLGVKVLGTEILAFFITLFFLADMLLAQSFLEFLIKAPVFVLIITLTYLLIRGLFKEIKSSRKLREQSAKIQTQSQKLHQTNIKLKQLLKMKGEFLNTVSHQLRTPTSIFRGTLSMLTEDKSLSEEEKEQFMSNARAGADRLLIILNGIMDAASFEGKLPSFTFKPSNIEQVIQESMKLFTKGLVQEKQITLEYQKPIEKLPQILIDPDSIQSAITKLIDNAIWYTKKNGKVIVSCKKIDNNIQIKVKDTGIGLTQEDKQILFKKFSRGRGSHGMNVNSSGLGLYIAKKIIQVHKGTIKAESEGEDKGSTFTITLPVRQGV